MHFGSQGILTDLARAEHRGLTPKATRLLGNGQTAWDPTSTSRVITGPARVVYTQHPDGSVVARTEEL